MSWRSLARVLVPQALTASRLGAGALAIAAASRGNADFAATLITLGAVTDGLDGAAARRFGAVTIFGIWFDYAADYVCYIVAPWRLSLLLVADSELLIRSALALPLLAGAVRYARNGIRLVAAGRDVPPLPGLGTVFFAFVPVTAIFLDVRPAASAGGLAVFVGMIVAFALLMNAPLKCPKLTSQRGAAPAVLILLAIEPFWLTRPIAAATVLIGLTYVVLAVRSSLASPRRAQTSKIRAAM